MLGYEWEKENPTSSERRLREREIKMKHKRHFLALLFAERKNVLCLCECGFYSFFDCIIVQLEETKQMNEWMNGFEKLRESQLKASDWNQHFSSCCSSGLPPPAPSQLCAVVSSKKH